MADQLGLFSGPPSKPLAATLRACRCILSGGQYDTPKGGSARLGTGWWHDRRCPAYEAPPAELMLLELGRDNLAWALRHWTGERPPRAEDFPG